MCFWKGVWSFAVETGMCIIKFIAICLVKGIYKEFESCFFFFFFFPSFFRLLLWSVASSFYQFSCIRCICLTLYIINLVMLFLPYSFSQVCAHVHNIQIKRHVCLFGCIPVIRKYGPFLRVFMREVTPGYKIKSGIGNSIDLGSFLKS